MTDDFTFKKTAQRIKRNHQIAKMTGDLSVLKGDSLPHFHHVYNGVPAWNHKFDTIGQANQAIRNMANKSEPNVRYFEEGPVEIEARLRGSSKRMKFLVFVAECTRRCNKKLSVEAQKSLGWLE